MRNFAAIFAGVGLISLLAGSALGQDFFIYPSQGQSPDQQQRDEYECYSWAKSSTGFDPMQSPQATAPPPTPEAKQGGLFQGALRGAATGAIIGAIAGDAGKGAAIGAAGGGLLGGIRRQDQKRSEEHAHQQWQQQQVAQYNERRSQYNRAHAACLGGRGYTVQ